jgi:hypothetical protein
MVPISDSLSSSLANLHAQIEAAERALHKMPGAFKVEKAFVEVGKEIGLENAFLEVMLDSDSRTRLCVREFHNGPGDESSTERLLSEFPVSKRVALAKRIPELIDLANEAEADVVKDVDEVAAIIERALADL